MLRQDCAAEEVGDGNGQRGAFFRVGGRTEFVEQHQRMRRGMVRDEIDVGDVRGKRRQVLLDGLIVADIGEDGVEDGQLGAIGGNRNSRLRHQRQQANRFQRDGLAASIGAADDELAMLAVEFDGKRDHRCAATLSGCAPAADDGRCAG